LATPTYSLVAAADAAADGKSHLNGHRVLQREMCKLSPTIRYAPSLLKLLNLEYRVCTISHQSGRSACESGSSVYNGTESLQLFEVFRS